MKNENLEPDQDRPWMRSFGGLAELKAETARIQELIDAEFGIVDDDD
jgi:hypothetical protein